LIRCHDACGATITVLEPHEAIAAGWHHLSITGSWRCGPCARALGYAAQIVGTEGGYSPDPLPPTSRGALPKETASSILPPTVKP